MRPSCSATLLSFMHCLPLYLQGLAIEDKQRKLDVNHMGVHIKSMLIQVRCCNVPGHIGRTTLRAQMAWPGWWTVQTRGAFGTAPASCTLC